MCWSRQHRRPALSGRAERSNGARTLIQPGFRVERPHQLRAPAEPRVLRCARNDSLRRHHMFYRLFPGRHTSIPDRLQANQGNIVRCMLLPPILVRRPFSSCAILAESVIGFIGSMDVCIVFLVEDIYFGPARWKFLQSLPRLCFLWDVEFMPSNLIHE